MIKLFCNWCDKEMKEKYFTFTIYENFIDVDVKEEKEEESIICENCHLKLTDFIKTIKEVTTGKW